MIGVPQNDLRFELAQFLRTDRLDASLRADRHERRRFDHAVRRSLGARIALSILDRAQ